MSLFASAMRTRANSFFDLRHSANMVFVPASTITSTYSSPLYPIVLSGPYASQNSFVANCMYLVLFAVAKGCFFIVVRHPSHCRLADL